MFRESFCCFGKSMKLGLLSDLWLLMVIMNKVVKIDSELLNDVEAFINLKRNRFRYVNRKQFVDMAVADYLRRREK